MDENKRKGLHELVSESEKLGLYDKMATRINKTGGKPTYVEIAMRDWNKLVGAHIIAKLEEKERQGDIELYNDRPDLMASERFPQRTMSVNVLPWLQRLWAWFRR